MNTLEKILEGITARLGGPKAMQKITSSSDLVLIVLLIAIIGMMIIPLPEPLLDFLIAINLSIAVILLMVSVYIPSAVKLSIFPSLLLITTLFRLGLNISSTRLILSEGKAGQIIETFAEFVVGGNLVVGAIIFLIITLVQFLVITKGAERVAEVAARFTLDAMPGKQMAIDADLRAGNLDENQARKRRAEIQKESQLYGAMDGAMKFVKGDAIAGIVITIINVIGGIIIGVTIENLTAADSAVQYSMLSIGDGLVSQIPSLLISITAGMVTTRVSQDDGGDSNLGKEISTQILQEPKALIIAAGVMLLMGSIPGMPTWAFSSLAALSGGVGLILQRSARKKTGTGGKSMPQATSISSSSSNHEVISEGGIDTYALTLPVILEIDSNLSGLIEDERKKGLSFIEEMIPRMRIALYQDTGVRFPGVHVRADSPHVKECEYNIHLNEVPIIKGKVLKGYLLTNETEDALKRYNLSFVTHKNTLNMPSLWVEEKHEELLVNAGIKHWKALEVVILHLSFFYRNYTNEFLGIQEVRSMIEFMEKSFPDLIKEVTRLVPLQKLTDIFKRLVQEQVSIKDLRTIMESLSEWAQSEKDTVLLTEYVRSSLKRYISYKYSQGQSVLSVYLLDPEIEDMVRGAIKQTSAGSYLALDPDSVQLILQSIRNTVSPTPPGGTPPVMLTAIDVRRFVRKLIEMEFSEISVVSYQEIIPEIKIQPLGRIQIS
ncbi:Low calcium response locus protein D [Chlamydiales bacterium SCGC AB-751-O23]|nr:Low calcium response locus protein D [Chlamydiales bacterium SCGC AB-751-O23]